MRHYAKTFRPVLHALLLLVVFASEAQANCDDSTGDPSPSCALLQSARRGNFEGVKGALEQGASVNMKDEKGSPLLHILFRHTRMPPTQESQTLLQNKRQIAHYLLEKGVDVQAQDAASFTALHIAVQDSRFNEFIDPLIDKGINPSLAVGSHLESPLIVAIDALNHAAVEKLIKRGADIEKPIVEGITPMIFAILKGDIDSVELLLKHGAKIDAPNGDGITPLAMAIHTGTLLTIDLLVREGADLDIRLKGKPSPRQLAARTKHQDIREAFENAVAKYRKQAAKKRE